MEFIAIVMGLLTLASLGFRGCCVDILGDNMTSLHWSTTLKFRSGTSSAAALCFVLLGQYKELEIGSGDFRTGASNVNADSLSRGGWSPPWGLICRRLTKVTLCHHLCEDSMIYSTHPLSSLRKSNCGMCGERGKSCWANCNCEHV